MKIYTNANLIRKHRRGVIAIGNFDGIHLGHQKVINEARRKAKKNKLPFGIMTFEPVPVMFFNSKKKHHRINSLKQKKNQLKKFKLDFLIIIKFNLQFSSLKAETFIKKIIYKKTNCQYLYVSKNFKFGFKRQGDIKILKKFEILYDFKTMITKPFKKNKITISSTSIRKKISLGKIPEANKLLNRKWTINGKIIQGEKRGRKIGFPTCNIRLGEYVVPRLGVYSVKVKSLKFSKKGIANVGYRPTFNGQNLLLRNKYLWN
tara:strand:- start:133 stop:915 length:783 start_codon:yes stop_codon:yes gene_type:complete